jgi:hypothetical protein
MRCAELGFERRPKEFVQPFRNHGTIADTHRVGKDLIDACSRVPQYIQIADMVEETH